MKTIKNLTTIDTIYNVNNAEASKQRLANAVALIPQLASSLVHFNGKNELVLENVKDVCKIVFSNKDNRVTEIYVKKDSDLTRSNKDAFIYSTYEAHINASNPFIIDYINNTITELKKDADMLNAIAKEYHNRCTIIANAEKIA